MEIEKSWAENFYVTKANLTHANVHDPKKSRTSKGKKLYTSVRVYNDLPEYNLFGVTDCIEATPDSGGVALDESGKKYKLCIVEYKPTKPKKAEYNEEDLMQVYAQKLCVDFILGCDADACLYYADVKQRIPLPLRENRDMYDGKLRQLLREMREYLAKGVVPPIREGQKCSGCSMDSLCIPTAKRAYDFRSELKKAEV